MTDATTQAWIRNPSDAKAAAAGCRFDATRAAYAVWWIERYCRLYEGEQAGEQLVLRGCHQCGTYGLTAPEEWDQTNEELIRPAVERAERFTACVAAGHAIDWQYDCLARIFGWVKWSDKWDRWVRRFRQGSIWVPKKNKKSPTLAATALYLMAGDGEKGQKVYLCAKDGQQAREIAGKHAVEMVSASPELSSECTINLALFQITHEATRSLVKPLSSANSRTQQSKEGLNGSLCVDEAHVVDREFIGRVSRAGISRSEPLHLEVSTAGTDPESYGRERFDLAQRVLSGEVENEQLFAAIYAAPQDLKDADLDADPLKWGRLANPAMGHTVDPGEYLADYRQSKNNLVELGRFKMYRLNVWQQSECPWLDMAAWADCRRDYTEDDLAGLPCVAALDLAKTKDTCSLVLIFQGEEEGEFRQLAYFWLPKDRAEELRDKVSYLGWERRGHVALTPGNITDYAFIRARLLEVAKRFQLQKLAYDDRYAEELIQRLIEEDGLLASDQVVSFNQSINDLCGPTDEYEGLVLARKLRHNGNALLTWQAGNDKVKINANQDKRPVKQKPGDVRTVDGIVAGVMAVAQAKALADTGPSLSWA